jgi:hypothetical protein
LAGLLRPGNAGSGTAADHITVLDDALAQLRVKPADVDITVRTDSAGLSHDFVDTCRARRIRFVTGHALTAEIAQVLVGLPQRAWQPAISADGTDSRGHAEVTEIRHQVDLTNWPAGIRMIARAKTPTPALGAPSPTATATASKCSSPTSPTAAFVGTTAVEPTAMASSPWRASLQRRPLARDWLPRTRILDFRPRPRLPDNA